MCKQLPARVANAIEVISEYLELDHESKWQIDVSVSAYRRIVVPKRIATDYARMAQVAMALRGNREMAIAAVERAFVVAAGANGRINQDSHVAEILHVRTVNSLEKAGVQTIGELCGWTPQELAELPNVSFTTIEKIKKALQKNGFRLGG